MGYRSEVAIVVYGNGPEGNTNDKGMAEFKLKYDALYAKQTPDTQTDIAWAVSTGGWADDGFEIHLDSVKWYEGYPFVDFFDKVLILAQDLELNTEMVVLGEEDTDNRSDFTGPNLEYRLGINRSISFN
jgi:hypothetical protein